MILLVIGELRATELLNVEQTEKNYLNCDSF
jgi:hypothetical protein